MGVNPLEIFVEHGIDVVQFTKNTILLLPPINDGGDDEGYNGDNSGGNGSQSDKATGFDGRNGDENDSVIGRDDGGGGVYGKGGDKEGGDAEVNGGNQGKHTCDATEVNEFDKIDSNGNEDSFDTVANVEVHQEVIIWLGDNFPKRNKCTDTD